MINIRALIFVFVLLAGTVVHGQSEMMIQGTTPNLHLTHTVAAKETWYSLGRMFNLSPKEIASYNKLTIDKPLSIGQSVRIPLTKSNFTQNNDKVTDEVLVPLYHTIQEKEWMYRISVNHNKVPIENLEKWNNISRDQAKAGMKLIVGFLKVKNGQSPVATAPVAKNEPAAETKKETPAMKDLSSIPRETPKKEAASEPKTQPVSSEPSTTASSTAKQDINFRGGYFKGQYSESGKESSGVSGIFKSTSGWNDGKYYALMNNVPVGTIVKVNFPSTNKSIYAKVLGQLPDMKESAGLAIRISEAAATELGAENSKFSVEVKY